MPGFHEKRILVVVLDGLRPDLVTPESMPFLDALRARGARPGRFHSVFPTATRVNAAALGAGASPAATGVVANRFMLPEVYEDRIFHTGKRDHVAAAERRFGGRFVESDTLGEALARHGLSLAVVCSGSPGTTHMVNPRADALGHVRLCLRDWRVSRPSGLAADLLARFGPIPETVFPNGPRMIRQTDMFLDGVVPAVNPDVSIMWYNDPDNTFHYRGLGSKESRGGLSVLDRELARLSAWAESGDRPTDLIIVSDHGHITAAREIDLPALLEPGGLLASSANPDGPFEGVTGYFNALSLREGAGAENRLSALEWLAAQPWCGPVFVRGAAFPGYEALGIQDLAAVGLDHSRTPDLLFLLNTTSGVDSWGVPGQSLFHGGVKEGGSLHGGLSPVETEAFFTAVGPSFAPHCVGSAPAGIPDVTPTVLSVLGIEAPETMTGRPLSELMADASPDLRREMGTDEILSATSRDGGRTQAIRRSICRGRVYLHSADVRAAGERWLP